MQKKHTKKSQNSKHDDPFFITNLSIKLLEIGVNICKMRHEVVLKVHSNLEI